MSGREGWSDGIVGRQFEPTIPIFRIVFIGLFAACDMGRWLMWLLMCPIIATFGQHTMTDCFRLTREPAVITFCTANCTHNSAQCFSQLTYRSPFKLPQIYGSLNQQYEPISCQRLMKPIWNEDNSIHGQQKCLPTCHKIPTGSIYFGWGGGLWINKWIHSCRYLSVASVVCVPEYLRRGSTPHNK